MMQSFARSPRKNSRLFDILEARTLPAGFGLGQLLAPVSTLTAPIAALPQTVAPVTDVVQQVVNTVQAPGLTAPITQSVDVAPASSTTESIVAILQPVTSSSIISTVTQSVLTPVTNVVETVVEPVINIVDTVVEPVVEIVATAVEPVIEIVDTVVEPVIDIVETAVEPVIDIVETVVEPVIEIVETAVEPVIDIVETVVEPVVEIVETAVEPVIDIVETVVEPVIDIVDTVVVPVVEIVETVIEPVIDIVETVVEPVIDIVDTVVEPVVEIVETMIEPVIDIVDTVVVPVVDIIDTVVEPVIDIVDTVVEPVMDIVDTVVVPVVDIVDTVVEPVIDIVDTVVEPVVDIIEPVIDVTLPPGLPELPPIVIGEPETPTRPPIDQPETPPVDVDPTPGTNEPGEAPQPGGDGNPGSPVAPVPGIAAQDLPFFVANSGALAYQDVILAPRGTHSDDEGLPTLVAKDRFAEVFVVMEQEEAATLDAPASRGGHAEIDRVLELGSDEFQLPGEFLPENAGLANSRPNGDMNAIDDALQQFLAGLPMFGDLGQWLTQFGAWPWVLAGATGVVAEATRRRLKKQHKDARDQGTAWLPELGETC